MKRTHRKVEVYEPLQIVPRTRQTEAELKKASRLKVELRRAMHEPLNPGGELHHRIRDRIREQVRAGLVSQQGYWHMSPRSRHV